MIEALNLPELEAFYSRVPLNLSDYRQWREDFDSFPHKFYTVASSNASVRSRDLWNSLGREIYDPQKVRSHASAVLRVLGTAAEGEFVVQQSPNYLLWFKGLKDVDQNLVLQKTAAFRDTGALIDFSTWRGGFKLRGAMPQFLRSFIDYAYILKWRDIEIISTTMPLILTLDHHLCVQYTSPDKNLIEIFRQKITDEGMLEYPERE